MTQKDEIRLLHKLISYRDHWYIYISAPEVFWDIGEEAKEYADKKLSKIGIDNLYRKYLKWAKSDKIISPDSDYYLSFLDDLVWALGRDSLKNPNERQYFEESINLKIHFI